MNHGFWDRLPPLNFLRPPVSSRSRVYYAVYFDAIYTFAVVKTTVR